MEILVAGPADLFRLFLELDLGAPIWRVRRYEHRPPEGVLLLIDLRGSETSAERIARLTAAARRHATIAVAERIDAQTALAYARAGALGAIDLARQDRDAIRRAVMGALRGEPAFGRDVLGQWLRGIRRSNDAAGPSPLTARQSEVIGLVARGATDREIATSLEISLATAQKHVANVLRRLGASNRAGAVGLAVKASLISPTALDP